MAHADPEAVKKHLRVAIFVFVSLLVLTLVTWGVAWLDMGHSVNIVVALLIASFKASLVALYFMHLISEKALIYWILGMGAAFFIFLIFLPLFTQMGGIEI